jgi:hypothetical protein
MRHFAAMFEAEVDPSKNLITIRYSQMVSPEDSRLGAERCEVLVTELKPGFRLLGDLTGLESMDLGCLPHIRRTMDLLNKHGVALVVRVIPDPRKDIGLNILSLFHYDRRVRIVTCETLAEAMRVLAG